MSFNYELLKALIRNMTAHTEGCAAELEAFLKG